MTTASWRWGESKPRRGSRNHAAETTKAPINRYNTITVHPARYRGMATDCGQTVATDSGIFIGRGAHLHWPESDLRLRPIFVDDGRKHERGEPDGSPSRGVVEVVGQFGCTVVSRVA